MPVVSADYLRRVYTAIATALGADEEEAQIFARCFVNTDLRGKDTQGIKWVPGVATWVRSGAARFGAPFTVVQDGPAYAVVDGGHGVGQVVATRAMDLAIQKAREAGLGAVWVRHSNDLNMAANFAMQALEHDLVGIAMSNGPALVAPWGGMDRLFSTNPIAIAIPSGKEEPIVIDTSASAISGGRVSNAQREGARLSGPWIVGEDGRLTDDPTAFGAIASLGPKGFGWLLLVEVLAGILSGMGGARDIPKDIDAEHPSTLGQMMLAIDVARLMPVEEFKAQVDALIRAVKSSRLAEGFAEIRLPGEGAARELQKRQREGIPVRDDYWIQIEVLTQELGIDLEALRAAG